MRKSLRSWPVVAVFAVVMSTVGFGPGRASAGGCDTVGDPIRLDVQVPAVFEYKPGSNIDIRLTVSNCSGGDWSGNLGLTISGPFPECVLQPEFPAAPVSVRLRSSQSVTLKGPMPNCTGRYAVHATAYDTAVQAQVDTGFYVNYKTRRPGA